MAKRNRPPEVHQFRPMTWDELDARIAAMFPAKPFNEVVYDAKYWMNLPHGRFGEVQRDADVAYALGKVAGRVGGGRRPTEEARRADAAPPLCNTGGKPKFEAARMTEGRQDLETITLVLDEGITKEVVIRAHGWGDDLAHVDQVSFTCHETTCSVIAGARLVSDLEHVMAMSAKLEQIFGFGVSHQRPKGMHFYKQSWVLGQEDVCYGNLHYGGNQRNTICVQITGAGALAAHEGWEKRLYDFLTTEAQNPRLTRVDLAYDDFVGDYTVDLAAADYDAGRFNCGGRHPYCEQRGDWKRPDGSGRTFYLGKRVNGKFARIYEKGKEQGCKTSDWVRVEVEFKNIDRVLKFEMLLNAGSYLAGAYPAFERFKGLKTPQRIDCLMKEQSHAIDHYIHYGAIQVGRLINYMKDIAGWSVEQIVKQLERPDAGYPQRLKLANVSCDLGNQDFIHKLDRAAYDDDEFALMPEYSFV
ncbi:replication initiation factor domain-containing protein [Aquitalea aquatilis]|uniref:replication initiation factor domain-containing protein n=1 Tax=Aquitalea aquatilis TaxID=1537400 RepID=UPI0010BD6547|nr:replication initiation factor domain-containing protein [Aquitalea aquatilis]